MADRHVEGYSASPALGHRRSGEMQNHAEICIKSEQHTAAPPNKGGDGAEKPGLCVSLAGR